MEKFIPLKSPLYLFLTTSAPRRGGKLFKNELRKLAELAVVVTGFMKEGGVKKMVLTIY